MSTAVQIQISTDPTTEEAAAVVAAILSLVGEGDTPAERPAEPADRYRWRDAAKLVAQGLTPTRTPARPAWGTIERLHRAGRGGSGITGL